MTRLIAIALLALTLSGCYESVNEKQAREQMQQDIKDLQRSR